MYNANIYIMQCQVLDCIRRYVLLCAALHVQMHCMCTYLIVVGWEECPTRGSSKWECILV